MYLDETKIINKTNIPIELVEEIELMDNLYYKNEKCLFYIKLNEIYAMAKTYLMSGMIDGATCALVWERYGLA